MRFPTPPLQSLFLTLLISTLSTASSLTITIPPSSLLPNANTLPAGTHATLTSSSSGNHPLTAPLTRSSTFVFRTLKSPASPVDESFLLDIHSTEFVFAPYRVDVAANGAVTGVWETFRGNPWENRGAEKYVRDTGADAGADDVVVSAKVTGKRSFYEERTKFSPLSLLKNPMILIALVAMAFMFGMPKLMENMDPEMREEFEKQSRSAPMSGATRNAMSGGGGPGGFDLASWMAGASPRSAPGADDPAAGGAATGRESGGATRRRA